MLPATGTDPAMWYESREEILRASGEGALRRLSCWRLLLCSLPSGMSPFIPAPVLRLNLQKTRAVDKLSPLTGIQMVRIKNQLLLPAVLHFHRISAKWPSPCLARRSVWLHVHASSQPYHEWWAAAMLSTLLAGFSTWLLHPGPPCRFLLRSRLSPCPDTPATHPGDSTAAFSADLAQNDYMQF